MEGDLKKLGFSTKAIHAGYEKNQYGALASPIYQTSTFVFDSVEQGGRRFAGEEEGYIYSRGGNPTNTQVENKVAVLEGAEAAISFASGMGAITAIFWASVSAGDHVIAGKTLYGCTYAYLNHGLRRYGVEVTFVDTSNPENIKNAMKENTKIVYLETPANPNMLLSDIKEISKIVHQNKYCKLVVDNTYLSPSLQRPIELGADAVVHSATKYLNGHGDVIAGFAVGTQEFMNQVKVARGELNGSVLSPFDAFLINRGIKTLDIRMERHCDNAQKVAEFIESHPAVEVVFYPGLKSFPQYELAQRQMRLPGAMIAFELKGGLEAGKNLMNSVELCTLAVSLGDAETLIQHPASMTHSPYTPEERAASGIPEGLVRLSVGLETVEDIIDDLKQALDKLL